MKKAISFFLLSLLVTASVFYFLATNKLKSESEKTSCLIVDNDGSFDDLRSLIFLRCSQEVVPTHLVFTEGVVEPKASFKNYNFLKKHHKLDEREPKVFHGSTFGRKLDTQWTSVRNRDRLLNNYFSKGSKKSKIGDLMLNELEKDSFASGCGEIELLILGPYTSVVKYWSEIAERVTRVVTMGGANEKFFNCWYDKESCRDFFNLVPREKMFSVNVPMKSANDSIFSFTRDFINSFQENPNLKLWQDIFLADPSGWEPEDMLMWDDLTSFFLLNSQSFKSSGGYWQPSSKPNTYLEEWKKLISYCATEENYDSI